MNAFKTEMLTKLIGTFWDDILSSIVISKLEVLGDTVDDRYDDIDPPEIPFFLMPVATPALYCGRRFHRLLIPCLNRHRSRVADS